MVAEYQAGLTVDLGMAGQFVTDGAGNSETLDVTGLNIDLTGGRMLRLTMTVDSPFDVGNLNFFLGVGGFTDNIKWRFDAETTATRIGKPGEQFQVTLQLSEVNTVAGSITLSPGGEPSVKSGFTHARLQVSDNATAAITVDLHSVEVIPAGVTGAFCSITFDDSHESIHDIAFPLMAVRGFPGTDYVITDSIGDSERATMADLVEQEQAGWEIAGHAGEGVAHNAPYTGLTAAEVTADLSTLMTWLTTNFPHSSGVYNFAYPGGQFFDTTDGTAIEGLVDAAGFTTARTILSSVGTGTHLQISAIPPAMPMRMYGASSISSLSSGQLNPMNLTAAGGMLDKLEANGGWMIFAFHRIVSGTPSATTEISETDFEAILDALAVRNITVLTVREMLGRLAAPSGYRYDTLLSVTAEALDTTETGVDVANSGGVQWGTVTPYNIVTGGEEMTVTAVSGTGASQTLTVTRSVNGVVASHDAGKQIRIAAQHRAYRVEDSHAGCR